MDLSVLLITGLTLLAIIIFQLLRKTGSKSPARGNQALFTRLKEESTLLSSSVEVFSELSEEYFVSINSNGFADLCRINDALKATVDCCIKLADSNDTVKRNELLRYVVVLRGKGSSPGFLFQMMKEELIMSLDNWDERLAEILVRLADGIHASSSAFKKVGRNRTSKRHNTTQLLNELVGYVRR